MPRSSWDTSASRHPRCSSALACVTLPQPGRSLCSRSAVCDDVHCLLVLLGARERSKPSYTCSLRARQNDLMEPQQHASPISSIDLVDMCCSTLSGCAQGSSCPDGFEPCGGPTSRRLLGCSAPHCGSPAPVLCRRSTRPSRPARSTRGAPCTATSCSAAAARCSRTLAGGLGPS